MSFDLHLRLTGLCALVPREPLNTFPDPPAPQIAVPLPLPLTLPSLRILLPKVSVGEVGSNRICEHHPILRVEQPDGAIRQLDLSGDEIEILTVDMSDPGVELQPTFSLVADLERVRSTFQVESALFTNPIGRDDIGARLRMTAAKAFGVNPSPQTLSFPTTPPYAGNFARGVRLEIRIADGPGLFKLTSFQDGTERTIPFGPKEDGTPVQAELSNLCNLEDLGPEDADFAAFYLLEQDLTGPFHVPKPVVRPGEIQGGATEGVTCIPARTNSHSGA